jgi:hypothetical protein
MIARFQKMTASFLYMTTSQQTRKKPQKTLLKNTKSKKSRKKNPQKAC